MNDLEYWTHIRAALLRQAKSLEEQRAGILQQVAAIERRYNITRQQAQEVRVMPGDSVSGIIHVEKIDA